MTKRKKKVRWKNEWISIDEQLPPIGALIITYNGEDTPNENTKGNINQYCDNEWFRIIKDEKIRWWRMFDLFDLDYYQNLSIKVFFEDLTIDKYKGWDLKQMYDFDFEKLRAWINNRPQT